MNGQDQKLYILYIQTSKHRLASMNLKCFSNCGHEDSQPKFYIYILGIHYIYIVQRRLT